MRSFEDQQGRSWQSALIEASYGQIFLVFSPLDTTDVRQYTMPADNLEQANLAFAAISDDDLRLMLEQSIPWQDMPK